jgi:predicted ATPase
MPETLRFTRLKLTNWRNFRSIDVTFDLRAFIIGPNASGKSNLLDSIRFLSELARPGSGGLRAAVEARGGFSSLRCLQARTTPYVEIDATMGSAENRELWRYIVRINVLKGEKFPTVTNEEVWEGTEQIFERHRDGNSDPLEFSQTVLEQVFANRGFRAVTDFFSSCRYLHVVPQIVRDRARARSEGEDPYGGDLLRRMKDVTKKTRGSRLKRIAQALQIAVPQFGDIVLEDDSEGVPHLYASYVHWRPNAYKQSETAFSDGTLRLIGLLWSIAEKGGPLLLEEPELSLNDAVVAELPRMFSRMQSVTARQIITTTHSTALLDDPMLGLKEVHRIEVDSNGSKVTTLADDPAIVAQVEGGMTIGQAVLPLLRPQGIHRLGRIDVVD